MTGAPSWTRNSRASALDGIFHRADIADDIFRDDLLGVENTSQVHVVDNIVVIDAVHLGDQLDVPGRGPAGIEGEENVLLVHTGKADEGLDALDLFLEEDVLVGGVAADDIGLGQFLRQHLADLGFLLNDRDIDMAVQEDPGQIIGDRSSGIVTLCSGPLSTAQTRTSPPMFLVTSASVCPPMGEFPEIGNLSSSI